MTEEELKAIELLKEDIDYRESDLAEYYETRYSNAERILINLVNRQQKEIETLREENFDTVYIQAVENFKDKIREKINQIYEEYQKILSSNRNLQEKNIATFQHNAMRTVLEELLGE